MSHIIIYIIDVPIAHAHSAVIYAISDIDMLYSLQLI